MKKTRISLALGAAALGLAAACSGGGPPDAAQVLKADGYVPFTLRGHALEGDARHSIYPASFNSQITSWALGYRPPRAGNGEHDEWVFVLTAAAAARLNATTGINGQPATAGPRVITDAYGVTQSVDGRVLKLTGTYAQLNADPLTSP